LLGSIDQQKEDTSYYRHSIHQFTNSVGKSQECIEDFKEKKAEDILEKGMLFRTLSLTKLEATSKLDLTAEVPANDYNRTMPSNLSRRKVI
jgi:hypothetical protein